MQMKCPQCGFEGEFKKGRVPFFIFSLIDAHIAANRAKKTFVCPECKTEIIRTDVNRDIDRKRSQKAIAALFVLVVVVLIMLYKFNN
jgi:predicted RNA-binding Zn-ribbon protein involved in translation (DUF1610 family)